MGKQTTSVSQPSRVMWDNLEEWVRRKVQEFIQSLLEEEITELLGRRRWERQKAVDGSPGYRNGYGKERRLALGDFDLALKGLLGEEAPVSASTVARLKEKWQAEWWQWKQRSLEGLQVVYLSQALQRPKLRRS